LCYNSGGISASGTMSRPRLNDAGSVSPSQIGVL
jgi:hypothetical protein